MSVVDNDREERRYARDNDLSEFSASAVYEPDPIEYEDTWGWPNPRRVIA
jgi:hypothetical protein